MVTNFGTRLYLGIKLVHPIRFRSARRKLLGNLRLAASRRIFGLYGHNLFDNEDDRAIVKDEKDISLELRLQWSYFILLHLHSQCQI